MATMTPNRDGSSDGNQQNLAELNALLKEDSAYRIRLYNIESRQVENKEDPELAALLESMEGHFNILQRLMSFRIRQALRTSKDVLIGPQVKLIALLKEKSYLHIQILDAKLEQLEKEENMEQAELFKSKEAYLNKLLSDNEMEIAAIKKDVPTGQQANVIAFLRDRADYYIQLLEVKLNQLKNKESLEQAELFKSKEESLKMLLSVNEMGIAANENYEDVLTGQQANVIIKPCQILRTSSVEESNCSEDSMVMFTTPNRLFYQTDSARNIDQRNAQISRGLDEVLSYRKPKDNSKSTNLLIEENGTMVRTNGKAVQILGRGDDEIFSATFGRKPDDENAAPDAKTANRFEEKYGGGQRVG